jgi:hypothetical protein
MSCPLRLEDAFGWRPKMATEPIQFSKYGGRLNGSEEGRDPAENLSPSLALFWPYHYS